MELLTFAANCTFGQTNGAVLWILPAKL